MSEAAAVRSAAPQKRFYSPAECAQIVGLSRFAIYSALSSGALRGHKPTGPNGRWRVLDTDLYEWAQSPLPRQDVPASAAVATASPAPRPATVAELVRARRNGDD